MSNLTDDPQPHYGKLPGVHPRHKKKIYIAKKSHYDGESATMAITIGRMEDREDFIDSLPDVVCYEGIDGLEAAFNEWLNERKQSKPKSI